MGWNSGPTPPSESGIALLSRLRIPTSLADSESHSVDFPAWKETLRAARRQMMPPPASAAWLPTVGHWPTA